MSTPIAQRNLRNGAMELDSVAKRIRWAREQHGAYSNAKDAAAAFGWNQSSYYGYENGQRTPGRDMAKRIGCAYRVRWEWLLEGEGNPTAKPKTAKIIGHVRADSTVDLYLDDKITNTAELPPGGTSSTMALEVREGAMRGVADNGYLIYFDHEQRPPTTALHGKLCVIELDDGTVLVRVLQPGRKENCYDLESSTEKTIRDRRVIWAARVTWLKPR
jgi:transcriptional regulator with XRE-family HTH domain